MDVLTQFYSQPKCSNNLFGWICSYTPEEIILASDFTPYRVSTETCTSTFSEAYMPPNLCPYVHRLFNVGYSNHYHHLSGLVFVYSCDPMRRLADLWSHYIRPSYFTYRLEIPRRKDNLAEQFLISQLKRFKNFLEDRNGRPVKEDDLREAIETLNHTRMLIRQLSELRRHHKPLITGKDFHCLVHSSMISDKKSFNAKAESLLEEVNAKNKTLSSRTSNSIRFMLCGCTVEDSAFYDFIENEDAIVVADNVCSSMRHYEQLVDLSIEPIKAIAQRYLQRSSCPRMQGVQFRIRDIINKVQYYNCHGVICHALKFCDLVQADIPRLQKELEQNSIPFLLLERESLTENTGQLKTRVQAFIEIIKKTKT